tara:strand:- start:664 stop:3060 length:2397 start_codon:yes stop_codon:yes gene_type:complete
MGATYTRQSTYADGDTISAADTNDEFNQLLAAFAASTGHTHDGTAGEGGPISALASNSITLGTGADTDIAITFDANTSDGVLTWMEDEDYFQFSDDILMSTTEKLQFRDTAIYLNSSTDGQLDIVADTEVQIAATTIDVNGNLDVSGTVVGASTISAGTAFVPDASDGAALGTSSLEFSDLFLADAAVINLGADQDTTLTHVADTGILLNSTRQLQFGDSGTYIHQSADGVLDLVSDTEIEINATTIDINGAAELSGNLTLGAQLRMPDNTASKILVADGTSYEEKAVGDLSEISTVAGDDVFLAVDTSGGGLKKITRSTIVSGLATSSAISNVVEDTTPQLGGNLDMNGADIVTTSNADLELAPNGTGHVTVKGNTNPGSIQFNCESNSHGQIVKAQAHDQSVTNVLTLPAGADSTLVSLVSADTLTNKTLTSPVINTGTFGTSILPVSADGTTLGSASKEFSDLFLADAGTVQFGNDQDVTLTHVADTGLLLNAAMVVQFRDSAINIGSPADGDLDINADDEIELNSTLIDVNGNLDVSGTIVGASTLSATTGTFSGILKTDDATEATSTTDGSLQTDGGLSVVKDAVFGDDVMLLSDSAVLKFGADSDVTLTHAADTSLTCNLMMAATTFEPSADTAAGDNAAIGYTSAEGLILTGQGSSTDVTIKNDADATVASIATGTTIFTMSDDVTVVGRSVGSTITTENDASYDLSVGNDFITTTASNQTLTFTNAAAGQSGNIKFTNGSNHTISAHADVAINADVLTTISASGTYHLAYYCSAASGNDTILVSASAILT